MNGEYYVSLHNLYNRESIITKCLFHSCSKCYIIGVQLLSINLIK